MKIVYKSLLDEKMNEDIDKLINQLEQAKFTKTYLQRANAVADVADQCQGYSSYWYDRLSDLVS